MMFNNTTLNSTYHGTLYPAYDGKIPWTVAVSVQFFMAMVGNFLIVWIVYGEARLRSTTNYLIANMAASDLIAGLFIFPYKITLINFDYQWLIGGDIGNVLCKVSAFTVDMSFNVSVYSCVVIAIDRYYAVAHPFKRPFEGKMKYLFVVIWIIAAIISSPQLYFIVTIQDGDLMYCQISYKDLVNYKVYFYIGVVLTSLLSSLIITFTYTLTIYKLHNHQVPGLSRIERRKREKQNKKILKHAVTIVVLLYLCHGFSVTFTVLLSQGKLDHLSFSSFQNLSEASSFILSLSLVYNFFIYLIFNNIYRENVKALLPKCFYCQSDASKKKKSSEEESMVEMHA